MVLEEFRAFSEPAKSKARVLILAYATKLLRASISAKDNVDGDIVSEANVTEASFGLSRREEKGYKKLASLVGAALVGLSTSLFASVLQSKQLNREEIIGMVISGALGAFLLAMDLPRDILPTWRRRRTYEPRQPLKVRRRALSQSPRPREPKA